MITGFMTNVELTDEQAQMFLTYQEHRAVFETLLLSGIQDIKNGQMILNFGPTGELMKVEIKQVAYVYKR